jgi:hypothetical protein
MKVTRFIAALAAVAIVGCATTPQDGEKSPKFAKRVQIVMYDTSSLPKSAYLDVYDIKPPIRPYKIIALLTCEGAPDEEAAMTKAILYRARMMGADAVLSANTSFSDGGGFMGSRAGILFGTRCVYRARAIVYTDK